MATTLRSFEGSGGRVFLGGVYAWKSEVPLGKVYEENGRRYQTSTVSCLYRSIKPGGRFRYRDNWYRKQDGGTGALELDPNMPFGDIRHLREPILFEDDTRVSLLTIEDRGPA